MRLLCDKSGPNLDDAGLTAGRYPPPRGHARSPRAQPPAPFPLSGNLRRGLSFARSACPSHTLSPPKATRRHARPTPRAHYIPRANPSARRRACVPRGAFQRIRLPVNARTPANPRFPNLSDPPRHPRSPGHANRKSLDTPRIMKGGDPSPSPRTPPSEIETQDQHLTTGIISGLPRYARSAQCLTLRRGVRPRHECASRPADRLEVPQFLHFQRPGTQVPDFQGNA